MSICPNCGAVAEGGPDCPRCGRPLPRDRSAKALALASSIIGAACGLAAAAQMIVDYARNGSLGWSLLSLASCAAAWILVGFPMLTYRRPALFLPVMASAALAYLWVLERLTGGDWFLPLALPIALASMAAAGLSVRLCLRATRRGPNVAAFILFGCSIVCVVVENALSLRLGRGWSFTWSAIAAVSALSVSALLMGIQGRLRPRS